MYTSNEYSKAAMQANEEGKLLYVMVNPDTSDESLVIAPVGYYKTEPNSNRTNGEVNKEFHATQLAQAKEELKATALLMAKTAITEGSTKFTFDNEELEIETNTSTCIDLQSVINVMKAHNLESYMWLDKNDIFALLSLEQYEEIQLGIVIFKKEIWSKYGKYLQLIAEAESMEDIEKIKIDYGQ